MSGPSHRFAHMTRTLLFAMALTLLVLLAAAAPARAAGPHPIRAQPHPVQPVPKSITPGQPFDLAFPRLGILDYNPTYLPLVVR
ncbi:MAG: hypothetical protein WCF84_19965 [Anaerolineae bacterium]